MSRTADEQLWVVAANSDVEPGETYLFDRKTKKLTLQYRIREKLAARIAHARDRHPLPLV